MIEKGECEGAGETPHEEARTFAREKASTFPSAGSKINKTKKPKSWQAFWLFLILLRIPQAYESSPSSSDDRNGTISRAAADSHH